MKKLVLCLVICVLSLCSCSDREPERETLEYEAPITTFVNALNRKDENSLLGCFTPGAKEEFEATEQKLVEVLGEDIEKTVGKQALLKCEIVDFEKLDDEMLESLSKQYTDEYSMRLDVKKAYELHVIFYTAAIDADEFGTKPMELITLKAGGSWYIFGDVIEDLELISLTKE